MDPIIAGSATQGQSQPFDPLRAKSKARLRLELEAAGIPHKALAYGIMTPEAMLSRILADHCPDDLPSYKIPALTRELGPGYMEWLALQCGGVYQHGATAPGLQKPIAVLVGLLAKQSGDTIQKLIQDLEDHDWSMEERQVQLPGLRKLHAIVGTLIQQAEGGAQ